MLNYISYSKEIDKAIRSNDKRLKAYFANETVWVYEDQWSEGQGTFVYDHERYSPNQWVDVNSDINAIIYEENRKLLRAEGNNNLAIKIDTFEAFEKLINALDQNKTIEKLSLKIRIPLSTKSYTSEKAAEFYYQQRYDKCVKQLGRVLAQHPKLTEFDFLAPSPLIHKRGGIELMAPALAKNLNLKKLSFQWMTIDEREAESLIYLLEKNNNLTHLGLTASNLTKKGRMLLRYMEKNKHLTTYLDDDSTWRITSAHVPKLVKQLAKNKPHNPSIRAKKCLLSINIHKKLTELTTNLLDLDFESFKTEELNWHVLDDIAQKEEGEPFDTLIYNHYLLRNKLRQYHQLWLKQFNYMKANISDKELAIIHKTYPDFDKQVFLQQLANGVNLLEIAQAIVQAKIDSDIDFKQSRYSHKNIELNEQLNDVLTILWKKTCLAFSETPHNRAHAINNLKHYFEAMTVESNSVKKKGTFFSKNKSIENYFAKALHRIGCPLLKLSEIHPNLDKEVGIISDYSMK